MNQDPPASYTAMIRDLPPEERPRERLKAYGPSALGASGNPPAHRCHR